ncbi:MAG: hypothetical protein KC620_12800, partial [Myxococcales bacterium]|nr:hypothetical protein [Myxococcales bacterium]
MRRLLLPLGCAALFTACAAEEEAAPGAASVITDVSASSVVIGETLEFFGEGFVPEDRLTDPDAELQVHLRGTFAARDGERVPVDLHLPAAFNAIDARHQILTVRRFGPYANPFTGDARLGRFEGKASVVRETDEGLVSEGKATSMTLDVEPSILIESFEPIEAECGAPAVRALAGMPYHMRVRVAGLKAVSFKYELSGVNANDGVTTVVHGPYGSPTDFDELGIDEAVLFNPVPEDMQSYISAVRVIARDANGATVETALPVPVHRPIEVRYGGEYALAEL